MNNLYGKALLSLVVLTVVMGLLLFVPGRMRGDRLQKETRQEIIMLFASMGFIALLIVPSLDYRFGWPTLPPALVIAGDVLVAMGFYFVFLVYKENTFTPATIEVAENQRVVCSGLYALAPFHVRQCVAVSCWHAACTRLVLGPPCGHVGDVIRDMEAL